MRAIAGRFAPGEVARAALAASVDALLVCSRADLRDQVLAALESAPDRLLEAGLSADGGLQARARAAGRAAPGAPRPMRRTAQLASRLA